jgi:hypothetical protein
LNHTGKLFQIYCPNSEGNTKGAISVLLQYNVWYRLSSKDKDPILGDLITKVHQYDEGEELLSVQTLGEALEASAQQHAEDALQAAKDAEQQQEQGNDESQDKEDPVNIQIQNSPIRTAPIHTFGKNRTIQLTMMTTITQTTPILTNPPVATTTKAQLIRTFDKTFKRSYGGGSSGGGGGGPGGPPGPLPLPPNRLVPIPAAADMQAMGNKPKNFYGDRAKADTFIEDVKAYLRLNKDVTGYNSPKNKIAFTLTCMKGDEVSGWTRAIREMLDTLPIDQNVPLL